MFAIKRDFEFGDPVILRPIGAVVSLVPGRDHDRIERQRFVNGERDALADAVALDAFRPRCTRIESFDVLHVKVLLAFGR